VPHDDRQWPSEDTADAMLERLSPCGRSIVLAFAFGRRAGRTGREAVALVVMHRMVFRTAYTERELCEHSGLSRNGARSACRSFAALMRRCLSREGLTAASMFELRRDEPDVGGDGGDE
jgi:hypothetical protein